MDICQITLITLNKMFLLVAPDTLSGNLLCSIQLLSTNMQDTQLFTLMGIHYLNLLLELYPIVHIDGDTLSQSLTRFSKYLKSQFILSYSFHCNINDCYTCQYS